MRRTTHPARSEEGNEPDVRPDDGAAAVEFALVAPLLIFLLFAIIGYGYMLGFRQAISQAAAEATRSAVVAPSGFSDTDVKTAAAKRVDESLQSFGVTCSGGNLVRRGTDSGDCTIDLVPCPKDLTLRCAVVTLDYDYAHHSLLPTLPGLGIVLPEHLRYTSVAEVS